MSKDVCRTILEDACHLVVVDTPFLKIFTLTNVDGGPEAGRCALRINVISGNLTHHRIDGVTPVAIRCVRPTLPVHDNFAWHVSLFMSFNKYLETKISTRKYTKVPSRVDIFKIVLYLLEGK